MEFKNILDILSFAYAVNKHTLVNILVDNVIKNFKLFFEREEFLEIQFLNRMLSHPRFLGTFGFLSSTDACSVNSIIRWIEYLHEERLEYLNQFIVKFKDASLLSQNLLSQMYVSNAM